MKETSTLIVQHYDVELELHTYRAMYDVETGTLIVSDLHLGRSQHYRNHGIPTPLEVDLQDLERLEKLLLHYQPNRLLLLGDLFHSYYNHTWEIFAAMTHQYSEVDIVLVRGNHDVLRPEHYQKCHMRVVDEFRWGPFRCTHHPEPDEDLINMHGHLHPGVVLRGSGRQRLRVPAFYFRKRSVILPSFGRMTGAMKMTPEAGDHAYVIAGEVLHLFTPAASDSR